MVRKILVALVGIAVVVCFASAAYSTETTKTKVKETSKGVVTKESTTVKTPEVTAKDKAKETVTDKSDVTKEKVTIKTKSGKETDKMKDVTTETGEVTKEKITVKTPAGKEKIKEKTTTTATGTTEETAKVTKKFKEGELKKEKVIYKSYTDENGGTIIVIRDKQEVKMPARHFANWKTNVMVKQNKEVTITSSYDPKLLTHVVTHVE